MYLGVCGHNTHLLGVNCSVVELERVSSDRHLRATDTSGCSTDAAARGSRAKASVKTVRGVALVSCMYEECVFMCVRSSVGVRMCESQQRFHQVQLVSIFAGEDGGFLVVLH